MNFGLGELLGSCVALLALPIFFLAPGYLLASVTGLIGFSRQSWVERLLWASALSLPISLLFTVHPGLGLSPHVTTGCFVLAAVAAAALAFRDWRQHRVPAGWDRSATIVLLVAAGLIVYVIVCAVPIEVHGRLYESAIWQDWDVRIQLVNAAIRGGNTPGNPMFAPAGQPAPLHYYYFWYVLCARMHDLVHVSARSILTASCAGAALSLLAFLLLAVKYLSPSSLPPRRQAIAALLAAGMLGLDIIPFTVAALNHRFYADLQFWLDDRSPGFLHMVLWSPHHVAGLVCCGLGTLLFLRAADVTRPQRWVHAVLAAICFAASAGTSTFITLLFAIACAVIFVDAAFRREWRVPLTMLGATVLAVILVAPFLKSVLLAPGKASGTSSSTSTVRNSSITSGHTRIFIPSPRYRNQSVKLLRLALAKLHPGATREPSPSHPDFSRTRWGERVFRPPFMAVLFLGEFGFFVFVLAYQVRHDLFSREKMSRAARLLWLIFAAVAVPGSLLTSGDLQGNNDFGRHAGFCLRLILVLWSAPLIATFLESWHQARQQHRKLSLSPVSRWAVAFALIGLGSQAAQIILVRVRFALVDAGLVSRIVVAERIARPAFRFGQDQQALAAAARITPPNGIVQGNPHSRLQEVFSLYTDRQMAAVDDGCNVPFGGDPNACLPLSQALIQLFGGMGAHYHGEPKVFPQRIAFDPALVTPANFARVCSTYKLNTLVVTFADPIWWDKQSWAWQLHPSFANSTARIFRCDQPLPATSATPPRAPQYPVVH